MATFTFPNGSTPDSMLLGVSKAVPVFPIMLLVFVWLFVFLNGVIRQNSKNRYVDVPQWAVLSSLVCLLLSLIMTIKEGFITLEVLLIVMGVTTLSAVWFFFSRGRFE